MKKMMTSSLSLPVSHATSPLTTSSDEIVQFTNHVIITQYQERKQNENGNKKNQVNYESYYDTDKT